MPKKPPKVSITVVTYNHGLWLTKCLESIVNQKANFAFEVFIGDDASTDGLTIEIIQEYAAKYPQIITPILREKNIGPIANYFDLVQRTRGEYIAHIDGDDYMLPNKIQRQSDFLDTHPDYNIASHKMIKLTKATNNQWIETIEKDNYPEHGTVYDLLKYGCYFCHSSKMYRRTAIKTTESPVMLVDYFLHIEHAISEKIYYSKEPMGCYRVHEQGISKHASWTQTIHTAYEKAFDRAIELGVPRKHVVRGQLRHYQAIALTHLSNSNLRDFVHYGRVDYSDLKYVTLRNLVIHFLTLAPKFTFALLHFKKKHLSYSV